MQCITQKSGWLPATAFAFLLVSLWTILALSSPSRQNIEQLSQQQQASYGLTLPNIIAPVIRKEVRKETEEEDKALAGRGCETSNLLPVLMKVF